MDCYPATSYDDFSYAMSNILYNIALGVKHVHKGHSDERTSCVRGCFLRTVSYLPHVKEPVTKGHLSYRDTFDGILKCPLKTMLFYCIEVSLEDRFYCIEVSPEDRFYCIEVSPEDRFHCTEVQVLLYRGVP